MDLSRVKSTKETITIIQKDKYPNTPVLELIPQTDNKRWTIKVNRNAFNTLGVNSDKKRLIMFNNYNVSLTDEPDYQTVVGLVADEWVQGPTKKYKSFQIHMNTRCVKSKDIYKDVIGSFNCDESIHNEFKLNKLEGLEGVYTLSHMPISEPESVKIEVAFDKGESVEIHEA